MALQRWLREASVPAVGSLRTLKYVVSVSAGVGNAATKRALTSSRDEGTTGSAESRLKVTLPIGWGAAKADSIAFGNLPSPTAVKNAPTCAGSSANTAT